MIVYLFKEAGKQKKNEIIIYLKLEMHNPLIVATQGQSMRTYFASQLNIACFVKKHYVSP